MNPPILLSGFANSALNAVEASLADEFLGSPLIVLASIIIIDIVALIYHKLRR